MSDDTYAESEALLAIATICGGGDHVEVVHEERDWILVEVRAADGLHAIRIDKDGRVRRASDQERAALDPAERLERLMNAALEDHRPK